MKLKEAIEIVNNGDFNSLYEAEEAISDGIIKEVASELNLDHHRWFTVSTNVYQLEDGYIGIIGVSGLNSECMVYSDCGYPSKAYEYEEFTTVSYRPKNN